MDEKSIFLTGFMGVGKSTIARSLAILLEWEMVDTDELIMQECGLSIPEIFKEEGEASFRNREKKIIESLLVTPKLIVALGGGALMDTESFEKIKACTRLVYLAASPEVLESRLQAEAHNRPLLTGLDAKQRTERICSLLAEREPRYQAALLTLSTDGLTPDEIAFEIKKKLFSEAESR